ncbi:MAG: glycoside hydrolase family 125 protein [Bacteroidales bacterium]|nr:glycoside hydrolase family 125 protein [Bacteroidales bacterium]
MYRKYFFAVVSFLLMIPALQAQEGQYKPSRRPSEEARLFKSQAVEQEIARIADQLTNPKLKWMFINCFPNTLDTTVHYREDEDGTPATFVYTGDIHAMWLRDSGAQVWPYVAFANEDEALRKMIAGVINTQFRLICIDPYANAFNDGPTGEGASDDTGAPRNPNVFERKWEIDSHCYPVRLAYEYWKVTGDTSVFGPKWLEAVETILDTFTVQQRKDGDGPYYFLRVTDRQLDTKDRVGLGNPVKPVGLIASAFRPSDDATQFEFLVPSNFFAVSILRKAAEILTVVNSRPEIAARCTALADEVSAALHDYAVYEHPVYGPIYAFETDGFGNKYIMDDANVPSLLSLAYLDPEMASDPIYQNTRRFVWSTDNPYFWRGAAGEGIGGPHIGTQAVWPMSIMMKAFTSDDDEEIRFCLRMLLDTDADLGFIHESFHKDDASSFTREWFAWQNTLFGELIVKLVNDGRLNILNSL